MYKIISGKDNEDLLKDFSIKKINELNLQEKSEKDFYFQKFENLENEEEKELIKEYLGEIKETMKYLKIEKSSKSYFYILDAFGSITHTSDYDFNLTIIPIKNGLINVDYDDLLGFIIEVTKLKSNLENKFQEIYRDKGMDRAFDANLYPNTNIFEDQFFKIDESEIENYVPGFFIGKNYITATTIQLCVVPFFNILKSKILDLDDLEDI